MSIDVKWPAKDPRDEGWFEIPLGFQAVSLLSDDATVLDSSSIDWTKVGKWNTPGDNTVAYATDVRVTAVQLSDDGKAIKLWATGGKPQRNYAISVGLNLADGSKIFVSAILPISGR